MSPGRMFSKFEFADGLILEGPAMILSIFDMSVLLLVASGVFR